MTRRSQSPAPLLVLVLALSACGGGGGGGSTPTPTSTPPPVPGAFTCPSSSTAFGAGMQASSGVTVAHRGIRSVAATSDPSMLEVTYAPRSTSKSDLDGKVAHVNGKTVADMNFDRIGRSTRVVAVDPANRDAIAASLRTLPGVRSVTPVQRFHTLAVSGPYITNDPVFAGTGVPSLYENASSEGQWDMHVIGLDKAFAYSQPGNGSGVAPNPNALGSKNIRLAVVDTGTDVTHGDIKTANVVQTKCFITNTSNTTSTSNFVTDPDGHGTNVAGIAGASVNNGFGYAGAGGNVSLMLYRVFPTPDNTCTPTNKNPGPQCTATGLDIASAINDAVNNGANVINLSFGGSVCSNGQDPDQLQGNAVANAIAHHVIVVAASGNDPSQGGLGAPACDPGVIAVGASAWNDNNQNGSGFSGSRKEYVTSYSEFGSTNALRSTASWGIVAPGGDGASIGGKAGNDPDSLHWIENAWTSTPYAPSDAASACTDQFGESNCFVDIDGTSMSSPHVAGAAALVLSVNPQYATPSAMYQLLCSTADDIGDPHQGCGRLNVYRAMAVAIKDPTPP